MPNLWCAVLDRSEGARCSSCGNALTASPLVDEFDAHRARAESVERETLQQRSEGHFLGLYGGRLGTVLFVCLSVVVTGSTLFFAWLLHVPLDRTAGSSPTGIALCIIVAGISGVGFTAIDRIVRRRADRSAARDEQVLGSPGGDAADQIHRRAERWREAHEGLLRRRMRQSQRRRNIAVIVIRGCFCGAVLVATIASVLGYPLHR